MALLARACQAATGGIVVRDARGRVIFANATAQELLGASLGELAGMQDRRRHRLVSIGGVPREEATPPFRSVLLSRNSTSSDLVFERVDASRLTLHVDVAPLADDRGELIGTVATLTDVSARAAAEAELEATRRELQERVAERTSDLAAREQRLQGLIETMADGLLVFDADGRFVQANAAAERMLGLERTGIVGVPFQAPPWRRLTLDGEPFPIEQYPFARVKRSGEPVHNVEFIIERQDGLLRIVSVNATPLLGSDGGFEGAVAVFTDITERHQTAAMLEEANEQLTLWVAELERRRTELTRLSELGETLQRCQSERELRRALLAALPALFLPTSGALYILDGTGGTAERVAAWGEGAAPVPSFDTAQCRALRRRPLRTPGRAGAQPCAHATHAAAGLCIPLRASAEILGVLCLEGAAPAVEKSAAEPDALDAVQQIAQSLAERIALALANLRLRETLRMQAVRDPLTGLYNRRYMEETLEREIRRAERRYASLGVIMLDVDHFKRFNDTFGHAAGDTLLQELSRFLMGHIRGEDIACRYGGEEIALILPEASLAGARGRADDLRERIKALQISHEGQPLGAVTVSMGVAVFPEHGQTGEALLRAADAALYEAKAQGRDRVVVSKRSG
ncbi:MAG TPA: diguanylate cyclase [Dehalococcoidia bacterium]|nr:diguanylate cyclase [Dehalococcoidia bacterium]